MKYSDGSIGKLSIPSIGVNKKVYDGETIANMRLGAAHFEVQAAGTAMSQCAVTIVAATATSAISTR